MKKRFIIALISVLCFALPASANIKISPDAVDTIIKQHFSTTKDSTSALATYKANLSADGSFSASNIWKICSAGGLNIKKSADKAKCQKFKVAFVKSATVRYYEVCGKDKGISGALCVRDFKDVQVTMTPAIKLAKEYAAIKNDDTAVQCSSHRRKEGWPGQDYVKCVSLNKNVYYEFEFDDVKESVDETVKQGIQSGVCGLYGADATFGGCSAGGTVNAKVSCRSASCKADAAKCKNINVSMSKFGYVASYKKGVGCEINFNTISKPTDLRSAYGIDNFVFCRGIQVQNAPSAESALKKYIVAAAAKKGEKITESQINCLAGFNTYTGKGCNANGITDFKDDVKTCKVGNKQIDFVFDDINESWNDYHAGGMQAMTCMTKDGIFDGENCVGLGEQQCKDLKAASLKTCPECEYIYWDSGNQICVLPSSKSASNLQKSINYGTLAVTVVAGTAITVASGGTAGAGVFVVVAKVGSGLMVTGAATKLTAEAVMTWGKFQPFVKKAQECILSGDSKCAEEIVTQDLQTYMSYKENFSQAEAKALDEIFAKLVEKIPNDSKFWDDFANNPDLWDCTTDSETCRVKEKKQFWQYASNAGDIMMIAGGLMRAIGFIGQQSMQQTTETIYKKVDLIVKDVAKPGKQPNLRVAYMDGIGVDKGGTFVSNNALAKLGLPGTSNKVAAETLVQNGTRIGVPFTQTTTEVLGTGARTVVANSVVPTVNTAALAGTALTQAHQLVPDRDDNSFYITKPEEKGKPSPKPDSNPSPDPSPNPNPTPSPDPSPDPSPNPNPTPSPDPNPDPNPNQEPSVGPEDNSISNGGSIDNSTTTFKPNKQKNTGLIVGLVAAGLVATGVVVGGVIAANSKNKATESETVLSRDSAMEKLLHNANGVLGSVDGKQVSLIPLPTTVNTNAKLVDVDGNAVAVVEYDGYKLPYYIKDSRWTPLLGIGKKGRWFNVYPKSDTGIKKLDLITDLMNQHLNPSVISGYIGINASGVSLPTAANEAFDIINAEFPNGVVQSENMTAVDAKLYSNNYNLIQRKLK